AQLRRLVRGADVYGGQFDERSSRIEDIQEAELRERSAEKAPPKIEALTSRELTRAANRASDFMTRITPSAFEIDPVERSLTTSRLDNPATLYGRWWHTFFQTLDWKAGDAGAEKLFASQLPNSPEPKTASKDWIATRRNLFREPAIAAYLQNDRVLFHRELPFAWRINDAAVVEGFIDLLMIDASAGRCLLLDWKTNRIEKGAEGQLRERYRPQLAAYWKAVGEITKCDVAAGIFATASGQFMPYTTEELEAEWGRLRS
ncbi:MAG TPA: PD-(D/E)XK nuclease family protein, partial [Chthoniobacterales bacterium]|nr:PD-(D/E)XK nuclease family protein [Chthoniobacterales bacterium]